MTGEEHHAGAEHRHLAPPEFREEVVHGLAAAASLYSPALLLAFQQAMDDVRAMRPRPALEAGEPSGSS